MDPPEHCRQSRAEESHADPKANNKCIMHSNFDACAFTCICIRYEKNIKTYKRFKYGIYGDYPFHLHGFFLPLGAHAWWFQPPMSWAWPRSHGKCSIRFMRFWGWTIGGLNIYCCPAAIELCKSIVAFVAFGDIGAVGSGIAEALMCGECGHLPSGYLT